jgi:hypothetical protein
MTNEQSMVERVAKAICCPGLLECRNHNCYVYEVGHLHTARYVIEAMREPTKAMLGAVLDSPMRPTGVIDDWQTMIDEALKCGT